MADSVMIPESTSVYMRGFKVYDLIAVVVISAVGMDERIVFNTTHVPVIADV